MSVGRESSVDAELSDAHAQRQHAMHASATNSATTLRNLKRRPFRFHADQSPISMLPPSTVTIEEYQQPPTKRVEIRQLNKPFRHFQRAYPPPSRLFRNEQSQGWNERRPAGGPRAYGMPWMQAANAFGSSRCTLWPAFGTTRTCARPAACTPLAKPAYFASFAPAKYSTGKPRSPRSRKA